jgi:hypothetical protein
VLHILTDFSVVVVVVVVAAAAVAVAVRGQMLIHS